MKVRLRSKATSRYLGVGSDLSVSPFREMFSVLFSCRCAKWNGEQIHVVLGLTEFVVPSLEVATQGDKAFL